MNDDNQNNELNSNINQNNTNDVTNEKDIIDTSNSKKIINIVSESTTNVENDMNKSEDTQVVENNGNSVLENIAHHEETIDNAVNTNQEQNETQGNVYSSMNQDSLDSKPVEVTVNQNVDDSFQTNGDINNTKSNKIGLIVFVVLIVVIILLFCFNYFFRLSGEKNVESVIAKTFESINNMAKETQKESKELKTFDTNGSFNLTINNEIKYLLNYDIGYDIKDSLLFSSIGLGQNNTSLLDASIYYENNNLYFKLGKEGKVYCIKMDVENINKDDSNETNMLENMIKNKIDSYEININEEEILYLIEIIGNGLRNGVSSEKIVRSLDGLKVKTVYKIDTIEGIKLCNSIIDTLKNDEKSVQILKKYDIDISQINHIDASDFTFNDIEKEENTNKEIQLILYSNMLTGKVSTLDLIDVQNYDYHFDVDNKKIALYDDNDKEIFNMTYTDNGFNINADYTDKREEATISIKCNIKYENIDNIGKLNGTINLKEDYESVGLTDENIIIEFNNATSLDTDIKKLDVSNAKYFDTMTDDEYGELVGSLEGLMGLIFPNSTEPEIIPYEDDLYFE